ncbi:unnamed protein product, partial [Closterium sp. NIES-64]
YSAGPTRPTPAGDVYSFGVNIQWAPTPPTPAGDVYSFGVVLLELLTARPPVDPAFTDNGTGDLIGWVRATIQAGQPGEALDPRMADAAESGDEMLQFLKVALVCVAEDADERPMMREVVEMMHPHSPTAAAPYPTASALTHSSGTLPHSIRTHPQQQHLTPQHPHSPTAAAPYPTASALTHSSGTLPHSIRTHPQQRHLTPQHPHSPTAAAPYPTASALTHSSGTLPHSIRTHPQQRHLTPQHPHSPTAAAPYPTASALTHSSGTLPHSIRTHPQQRHLTPQHPHSPTAAAPYPHSIRTHPQQRHLTPQHPHSPTAAAPYPTASALTHSSGTLPHSIRTHPQQRHLTPQHPHSPTAAAPYPTAPALTHSSSNTMSSGRPCSDETWWMFATIESVHNENSLGGEEQAVEAEEEEDSADGAGRTASDPMCPARADSRATAADGGIGSPPAAVIDGPPRLTTRSSIESPLLRITLNPPFLVPSPPPHLPHSAPLTDIASSTSDPHGVTIARFALLPRPLASPPLPPLPALWFPPRLALILLSPSPSRKSTPAAPAPDPTSSPSPLSAAPALPRPFPSANPTPARTSLSAATASARSLSDSVARGTSAAGAGSTKRGVIRAAPVECIPNAAQGFSGEGVFAKREKKQQKKQLNQAQQQEQQEEKLPSNHVQLFDQEEEEGSGTEQESSAAATRPFVYVYDLGKQLTSKVLKLELEWYSEQYDLEKHLTEMLMRRTDNPVRTMDPEQASLFFVPFYVSRYLFSFFHNDKKNMRQCIEKSSRAWTKVLKAVRTTFPYFNRTNGRDHFGILTLDHGRCHSLTFVDPRLVGEMFFVTYNGDKLVRSDHAANDPSMQLLSYQYGAPADPTIPSIPCYMPDRDIPVPVIVRGQVPFVSPFATPRKWTAIFRFVASPHKHVLLDVRSRIIQVAKEDMAPGWDMFPKSEERTDQDWQHSVFCICPPGHSQWTSRPFKALISGCIPVTFFREHDNPWQRSLNYDAFSINIDPDDVPSMRASLEQADVPRLQKGVEKVQALFRWSGSWSEGAESMLLQELRAKVAFLHRFKQD